MLRLPRVLSKVGGMVKTVIEIRRQDTLVFVKALNRVGDNLPMVVGLARVVTDPDQTFEDREKAVIRIANIIRERA